MAKILICGYGNIGHHVEDEFEDKNDIVIYDKYNTLCCYVENEWETITKDKYDAAFICVPTEMNEDGTVNTTEIFDIVPKVRPIADVVIIKSAIPVGTCEELGCGNVVCSPEFYGTTQHSLESPGFAIIGCNSQKFSDKAAEIYQTVKPGNFKFIFTDCRTAELAKYMENCWIATKVTFCNEFASIAKQMNISYPQLRECFIADERVSPSHTFVYPDKPYFDSHCLNKDIPGLITQCDENNIDTPLMDAVLSIKKKRQLS